MTGSDKRRPNNFQGEIELKLDELLGKLGAVFQEAVDRLDGDAVSEVLKERSFNSARGPIRASAGVRVRTAGQSVRRDSEMTGARDPDQPINSPSPPTPASAPEDVPVRDLTATVFSDPTQWSLVAELPGVAEDDIRLSQDGADLVVTAEARGRRYEGRFEMPPTVALPMLEVTAQNGIVEISAQIGGAA